MAKLANPWKCDCCGVLRARDTNHWLIAWYEPGGVHPSVEVLAWSDDLAEIPGAKHCCGIDCALKIIARLLVENFFPGDAASEAAKETLGDA